MAMTLPVLDAHVSGIQPLVSDADYKRLRAFQWRLRRHRRQGEAQNTRYIVVRRVVLNNGFAWERLENRVLMTDKKVGFRNNNELDFTQENLVVLDEAAPTVAGKTRLIQALANTTVEKTDVERHNRHGIMAGLAKALSTKPREEMTIQELLAHHILVTVPNYGIKPH